MCLLPLKPLKQNSNKFWFLLVKMFKLKLLFEFNIPTFQVFNTFQLHKCSVRKNF